MIELLSMYKMKYWIIIKINCLKTDDECKKCVESMFKFCIQDT